MRTLLMAIVVHDLLLSKLSVEGMYRSLADDITIMVESKLSSTFLERSQITFKIVVNLCKYEKVSVNSQKTVVFPFTRNIFG